MTRTYKPSSHADALHKLPPHAMEAEMALLGCILADPSCLSDIRLIVPEGSWFMRQCNTFIFNAMLKVADANHGALDLVLLNQHLEDVGKLKLAGGLDYLVDLAQAFPSALHARRYALLVKDKHLAFVSLATGGDLVCNVHNRPDEFRLYVGQALAKLMEVQKLAG